MRSPLLLAFFTLATALVAGEVAAGEVVNTKPYNRTEPVPDMAAQVYVESKPRELHTCQVTAMVDRFGEVKDVVPTDCPESLRKSSVQAVRAWDFHPPVQNDMAVDGQHQATFGYISNTVRTPVPRGRGIRLVRMEPTARPDWPSAPRTSRTMKTWMEENWAQSLTCILDMQVSKRGTPEQVQIIDCPELFGEAALERLNRYGMTPLGAEPGDGTVYRMYLQFELK
ncbi:MAG: hypothetical protein ACI9VR_002033 [Cognaticolwellia sp.]|jgi:hypothetical protein